MVCLSAGVRTQSSRVSRRMEIFCAFVIIFFGWIFFGLKFSLSQLNLLYNRPVLGQSQIFLALLFCIIQLLFLHNSPAFGCVKHKRFFVFLWRDCEDAVICRKSLAVKHLRRRRGGPGVLSR